MPRGFSQILTVLLCTVMFVTVLPVGSGYAQGTESKNAMLLAIFLKHDQSKTLEEINKHLDTTGFWKEFPPEGTEVVSWYVMMGIGQVVTLRLPPEKLRAVNVVIEKMAWGAFKTEFYPTYDFRPIWETNYKKK